MQDRKWDRFIDVVRKTYYFDQYWWSKDSYELIASGSSNTDDYVIFNLAKDFLAKCVVVFLFNEFGEVDASIGVLDNIATFYDFKTVWFDKNSDKIPISYRCISTKKFCNKLRSFLLVVDFLNL